MKHAIKIIAILWSLVIATSAVAEPYERNVARPVDEVVFGDKGLCLTWED